MSYTKEEHEEAKRAMGALWDASGTWRDTPAREVCMSRELFVAYASGVETGRVKHYGGPRANAQPPSAPQKMHWTEEELKKLDGLAHNLWITNAEWEGCPGAGVRDQYRSEEIFVSRFKAFERGSPNTAFTKR